MLTFPCQGSMVVVGTGGKEVVPSLRMEMTLFHMKLIFPVWPGPRVVTLSDSSIFLESSLFLIDLVLTAQGGMIDRQHHA